MSISTLTKHVGHDIKIAAVDVAHVIEAPISLLVKAEKVLASAIKDQPDVKAAVINLIKQAETVISDVTIVSASKGLDLASDAKALADAEIFFQYFRSTFIPLVEAVYKEVAADIK